MQLTSEERLRFYRRVAVSAAFFFLFFSVALNIFLFMTRVPEETVAPEPVTLGDPFFADPQAFGVVKRGFPIRVQEFAGTSAILPVTSYELTGSLLPKIPAALSLYRDQGFPADYDHIAKILKTFRVPFTWESFGVLPTFEKWYSADRTLEFVLDISKRTLTVNVLGSFAAAPQGPADDVSVIAIAEHFLDSLTIDHTSLGSPYIADNFVGSGGRSKTFVVWPTTFDGVPLIDVNANPVPAIVVEIARLSRKPFSATMTFFSPESLSRSSYSRTKTEDLVRGFMSGGLLPAPNTPLGSTSVATYSSVTFVYVVLPADTDHPLYIVPAVRAVWMQAACDGCVPTPVATFLPAIDNALFHWYSAPALTASGSNVLPETDTIIKRASGSGS